MNASAIDAQRFAELAAQGYNRIPVCRQVLADLETPLSCYLKLANTPYSYLFESVQGGEKWGRYSIIGLSSQVRFAISGQQMTVTVGDTVTESAVVSDPLQAVRQFQQRYKVPFIEELPMFPGGLVGYFGYDTVRYVEPRLAAGAPPDSLNTPDILLMVSDELLVFDNLAGTLSLIVHADPAVEGAYASASARLDQLVAQLQAPMDHPTMTGFDFQDPAQSPIGESDFVSSFGEQAFHQAVERIREYVLAGDVMQVVISQRLSVAFDAEPLNFYRALRNLNPSPYMYYLNLDDFQIVGSSPEILARLQQGEVTVRPIAGTRRRGHTPQEDLAMEQELLADPKEIAEHLMLIDLGRNDAGRISQTGSVKLTEKMQVERYSHVMHIVSNVTGQLQAGRDALDVLAATLPAGTLSGAPKIRAMEIIDELEPVKRGIYGGAIGYISWHGDMDTAIAIRTAVIKQGQLHVQAGAGIVADSQPRLEWKETMNKARALFTAASKVLQRNDSAGE